MTSLASASASTAKRLRFLCCSGSRSRVYLTFRTLGGLTGVSAPMVGIEAVLQADPELIVGTSESSTPGGGVMLWKAYPALQATKANNLTTVDGNLLNRAGPRMIDGAAALCARVQQARAHRSAVR